MRDDEQRSEQKAVAEESLLAPDDSAALLTIRESEEEMQPEPPAWYQRLEQKLDRAERRRGFRDALFPLLGVLIGGLVAFGGSFAVATYQNAQEAAELLRQDRVEKYQAYSDAANAYAVAAQSRFESCQPNEDAPLDEEAPCSPIQDVYQSARYEYAGAWQNLELVGSERARRIAQLMTELLPSTSVGFTGTPIDTTRDLNADRSLSGLFYVFNQVQRCDTAPVELSECAPAMKAVDDIIAELQ